MTDIKTIEGYFREWQGPLHDCRRALEQFCGGALAGRRARYPATPWRQRQADYHRAGSRCVRNSTGLQAGAAGGKTDAIIALGAVIRGGTPHFEYVAGECTKGIACVSMEYGLPIAFGVLTVDTIEPVSGRDQF